MDILSWSYHCTDHLCESVAHTKQCSKIKSSHWHHIPGPLLIYVWYLSNGGVGHADRVASTKLHFISDELLPETIVGPHNGSTGPDAPVGLQESRSSVLHQIGHAQGGGAAHTGVTVHQSAASALCYELYFICHLVEVVSERGHWGVGDRDVDVLHPGESRALTPGLGNVDDAGYLMPRHLSGIISRLSITHIQMVGDLTQAGETCKT